MEQLTSFVSSRGILKSCASHNRTPVSSHPLLDAELIVNHRPGGAIHVCTDALANFAHHFLPHLTSPFVLVSGDSDIPVSDALLAEPLIAPLVDSPYLTAWYAQNLSARHPKLHALPIGLDYHTMWERPGLWGITAVSPMAQENSLINILAASPEFNQRYLAGYCNWHFAMGRGDRQECYDKADKAVCYFEANAVPRNSTWLRQAECMYVVSPEGAGMDCHRTWEALFLGCVPIVKRNPLAPLFDSLPVLQVEDWSEINQATLLAYAQSLMERKFDFSSLFREYWMCRIAGRDTTLLSPMTFADFRKLLTRKTG
jgi:hypothetical protein